MPRPSRRSVASPSVPPPVTIRASSSIPVSSSRSPQLAELRKQWKWAAVSQFLYTFASLIALSDVTLNDVENDLVLSTMSVLPRLMHRLLYTLTQDRKINLDTWQTSLRKQYMKRNPDANPIGPEPELESSEPEGLSETSSPSPVHTSEQDKEDERESIKKESTQESYLKIQVAEDPATGSDANTPGAQEAEKSLGGHVDGTVTIENRSRDLVEFEEGKTQAESTEVPRSRDWAELSMLEKLESIHTVMEWHFQNPLRLRTLMRSDDEYANWRTEPIGYDAKYNAYWLIGVDRLWLQRHIPNPPRKNKKGKGGVRQKGNARSKQVDNLIEDEVESRSKKKILKGAPSKRKHEEAFEELQPERVSGRVTRRKQSGLDSKSKSPAAQVNGTRMRAAKTQANAKLDEQAKQLAAAQAEMKLLSKGRYSKELKTASPNRLPPTPLGTRVSRRLRGLIQDDEWQQIPDEWLEEGMTKAEHAEGAEQISTADKAKRTKKKAGLDSSEGSELTELSDSESSKTSSKAKAVAKECEEVEEAEEQSGPNDAVTEVWPPPNFIEWETICVTLDEWDNISKRFEGSSNKLEKALHSILTKEIVPNVTAMLREVELQRQKEEAILHRKRSSRIAIKESEKEEARLAAQRSAEEDERLARERRLEARARKEEEERLAREKAREQRRKEREEREENLRLKRESAQFAVDVVGNPDNQGKDVSSISTSSSKVPSESHTIETHTVSSRTEDWELDCEICGAKGINRDDGVPIMSCGKCSRWQHISCHDAADVRAGRPKRNWDIIDFTCRRCLIKADNQRRASGAHMNGYQGQWTNGHYDQRGQSGQSQSQSRSAENPASADPNRGYQSQYPVYPHNAAYNYAHSQLPYGSSQSTYYRNGVNEVPPHSTGHSSSRVPITFTHYQPDHRGFSPYLASPTPSQQSYIHQQYYGARPEQSQNAQKGLTSHRSPSTYEGQHNAYSQSSPSARHENSTHINGTYQMMNRNIESIHSHPGAAAIPIRQNISPTENTSNYGTPTNQSSKAYTYYYQQHA